MGMNGMPPTRHCEEDVRTLEEGGKTDATHVVGVCTNVCRGAGLGNALVALLAMDDIAIESDPTHLTTMTMVIRLDLTPNITKDMADVAIITRKLDTTLSTTLLGWAHVPTHPTTHGIDRILIEAVSLIFIVAEPAPIEPLTFGALELALTNVVGTADHVCCIKPCIKNLSFW